MTVSALCLTQVDVGLPAEPPQTSNGNLGGGLSSLPRRLLIRPVRGGGASLLVGNEATPFAEERAKQFTIPATQTHLKCIDTVRIDLFFYRSTKAGNCHLHFVFGAMET